jgi:hypothetical protein
MSNTPQPEHAEQRHALGFRCICGYQAKDQRDLDEHIEVMTR